MSPASLASGREAPRPHRPPRALGSGRRATLDASSASAPLRARARGLPAWAPRDRPEGGRPEAGRRRPRGSASTRWATCSGTCRTGTATPTSAEVADLRIGEATTIHGQGPLGAGAPHPPPPADPRGDVADATGPMKAIWFNQAWLAEKLTPGTRVLLQGKLDRAATSRSRRTRSPDEAAVAGGAHTTGIVPVHPASERLQPAAPARVGLAGARPGRATRSSRCRRSSARGSASRAPPTRSRAAHFPRARARTPIAPAAAWPSRSSSSTRPRSPPAARRQHARPARASRLEPAAELSRALARVAAVRAHRRTSGAAFAEIDADLASRGPMQRLLMGEVGSGKTVCRRVRDAARASSRAPRPP